LNSRCAQTNTGWEALEVARAAARKKSWFNPDVSPYDPGDPDLKQWQLIWNYDPVPVLRTVHCPVLSIFGERDPLVPPQRSADAWQAALWEGGNRDVTIKIFPRADHGIADTKNGIPLADYFVLQRDWLLKRTNIAGK
jgi:pimeloyl-ACP methyl ester carboxylesterase